MAETTQGSWYERNKKEYNKKRRERYISDKAHADSIRTKAREAKRAKIAERNGMVERIWKGQTILVQRIGDVADEIGVSVNVIRSWEVDTVIPRPVFGGKQRVYTDTQVVLLRELAEALAGAKNHNESSAVKGKLRLYIKKHWMEGLS